jgi:hypothetical protein
VIDDALSGGGAPVGGRDKRDLAAEQSAALAARHLRDVAAREADRARVGQRDPGGQAQQSRLARAPRATNPDQGAGLDFHRYPVEDDDLAVAVRIALADVQEGEQRRHRQRR